MLVIGETISVVRKDVANALENIKDLSSETTILDLAKRQVDAGANYLDLNIGPSKKSGPKVMQWLVTIIQEKFNNIPLCLDTKNYEAIEAGLEAHTGKAIINSTLAVPEQMEKLFPLANKYNASIIALTLAERGIPQNVDERCLLATDIITCAMEFGVNLEDIYLDPLVLAVKGMQDHAMEVIESIKMFKELNVPPMKTVVGLSNISNGAKYEKTRSDLNRVYLIMALMAGLDAAIMDALDTELINTLMTVDIFQNKTIYHDDYSVGADESVNAK